MRLNRAAAVKFSLGVQVSLVRKFGGIKSAKVDAFLADINLGDKSTVFSGAHTKKPTDASLACAALILHIYQKRDIPKIVESVVQCIAIAMVNHSNGPFAFCMKPRKSMGKEKSTGDTNGYAPRRLIATGNIASLESLGRCFAPSKYASFGIVVKKVSQKFCGKIGVSHDAPCQRIGQRPNSVSALLGPRHFNAMELI